MIDITEAVTGLVHCRLFHRVSELRSEALFSYILKTNGIENLILILIPAVSWYTLKYYR